MKLLRIRDKRFTIGCLVLLSIFLISSIITAQELSIEDAIQTGLENNSQIKDIRNNIQQLKRNLSLEEASNDWQLNLNTNYDYSVEEEDDSKNLNLTVGKTFLSGLEISPDTRISIDEDLDTSFNISLSKRIYPQLPTGLAETYYRTDKEILKAESKLREQKVDSILTWLEAYLNMDRMTARQDVFGEGIIKAEDNLSIVLEREKLGDAGKNEILTAKLSLENAKYSLQEAEMQLEDMYYNLATELGFSDNGNITLKDNNHYIAGLREKAGNYASKYLEKDLSELMAIVEKNNSDLQANLLDREVLHQELNWSRKEDDPSINLTSSYNTDYDELTLGLNLSYQLYDSGQHEINLEEKEMDIEKNIDSYDDLYNSLKQELKQHKDDIELSQSALKKEELSLARSRYELEVAEKQLAAGLIDYLEYQEHWISAEEAKISLKSLEDQLLLNRLEFIKFISKDDIEDILGGF